ncbi:hypothetical protein Poli38472_008667 [Pythium oligandrum]|uniref:Eukaryotic translation initiation factor 4E n=1 Tax=Pythium oligandrum TaxID=41045 RepID=A0A8K1C3V7_PYTOL|nr:hypothetical protein Poli38472_008667 [Pythium oligandrum]|eukprot:TMW56019.1 hypothetical protein Poli38472_008667 [Pythium oligandrum]
MTVELATNETKRHELQTGWSFWEQREIAKNMAYSEKLSKLCTFRTVEEFWGYWNNIPKPSQVLFDGFTRKRFSDGRAIESFAVFKEGIGPEWEDPENKRGGEWSIRKEVPAEVLDECWERLVLGAIGELFDPANEITGVRVIHKNKKDKKEPGNNYRFEIWLRSTDRSVADEIRGRVLDVMNPQNPGPAWVAREFVHKNH